jgi:hypothetical protein
MSKATEDEDRDKMHDVKRPAWWYADVETFMRHMVSPEEDRRLYGMPPWQGGFRWFRSPNVVCFEKYPRAARKEREHRNDPDRRRCL